jgi:class 3 adenylate cyclase/tetratricopeptide (TPR) repeat protein
VDATCARCGEPLPAGARFCPACAAPVAGGDESAASRRVVTVFFSDVAGSTELGERLDAEAVRGVMNRYFSAVSAALERHGGHVEKFIGDAVVALFGVPQAHEDDALRCVRAAVEARKAVRALGDDLDARLGVGIGVRIGIATGEVVVGASPASRTIATGDTMNTAARLQQVAPVGEILIGAATYRLVQGSVIADPVEPLDLKGKAAPVAAHRVVALDDDPARRPRPAATPLVGRMRELGMLRDAFDRMAEERSCRLVTVLGTAGVGKSRLVAEFLAGLGPAATVCAGRCLSYGDGVTYWALAEAVKALAGVDERDSPDAVRARIEALANPDIAAEVADGVGSLLALAGADARVEDARIALRRLFECVGGRGPLVVALDDVHWAEPPLLDLIDELADWLPDVPVLLLCLARPELLDVRPAWAGGKLNATTLLLEPLSQVEGDALVRGLLGDDLPDAVAERIVAAAEGNPLFAEELVEMLVDDGHLRRIDGRVEVIGAVERLDLPPTIQALLTARLDRLSSAERGLVERASIEGQVFHLGALAALGAAPDEIPETVRTLARKQLFRTDQAALPGQDAYRFRHILIREAAYERVAKEIRARWHEAFADWLQALAGERLREYEEVLGHHLAEAARFRLELGDAGEGTRVLAGRAATLFRGAADRAAAQGDFVAAARLLRRVAALLPADDPARAIAIADCADWLFTAGHMQAAAALAAAATAAAETSGDAAARIVCQSLQRMVEYAARPDVGAGEEQAALDDARAGADMAEREGRPGEAARLWVLTAIWEGNTLLRCARARQAAERARELGQRVGSPWLEAFGVVGSVMFLLRGSGRIPDLLRTGEEAAAGFGRAIRADYLADTAVLLAQCGDTDAALGAVADLTAIVEELGYKDYLPRWLKGVALVDAGRPADAIEPLELAAAGAGQRGDVGSASSILGLLARALALTGRMDGAARRSAEARAVSSPSDRWSALLWRGAAVRVYAAHGRPAEARALAGEMAALLADIDYPGIEFHARLDAAEGYRAAGDRDAAEALLQRAIADSEARQATGLARQATAALAEITVGAKPRVRS